MRVAFKTFGCRANSVDTDILLAQAKAKGFSVVSEEEVADAYIINSCTVTSHADRDAKSQARRFKRQNPAALVGVVGCYAQVGTEELSQNPFVDLIVGTAEKHRILDLLDGHQKKNHVGPATGFLPENFLGSRRSRASIKIQDGCNYSCSYCIIPKARGRSKSLPVATVLNQINQAKTQGFEEVVLTGIHLATYGWDQNSSLEGLLREILKSDSGPRVRLSTLDPFEISEGLLELLRHPRLCPYFHIALQSGSDRVLEKMRRFYRAEEFLTITKKIHQLNAQTFVGVDVIVGFPGEMEEDFSATYALLKEAPWSKLHVFPYSERSETAAVSLPNKIPQETIYSRAKLLRKLSEERYTLFLESAVGLEKDILIERAHRNFPGYWYGHTENYLPVLLSKNKHQPKALVRYRISKRQGNWLFAD